MSAANIQPVAAWKKLSSIVFDLKNLMCLIEVLLGTDKSIVGN